MDKYTIYCTGEQTKKALELGAPISTCWSPLIEEWIYKIPTAEQMIGWLEDQIDNINVLKENDGTWLYMFYPTNSSPCEIKRLYHSRKEATLAAIDAALDYLIVNKK